MSWLRARLASHRRSIVFWAVIVIAIAIWQVVVSTGIISRLVIAAPSDIISAAREYPGEFLSALGSTVGEIALSILIVTGSGLVVGALIGSSELVYEAMMPIVYAVFGIPWIIAYPFFVLWAGLGDGSKVFYASFVSVIPVTGIIATTVRSIDAQHIALARAFSATRIQVIKRIALPACARGIFAGFRLGVALVIISVLLAQLLSSTSGLGYLISNYRETLQNGPVYLGIGLALAISLATAAIFRKVEANLTRFE